MLAERMSFDFAYSTMSKLAICSSPSLMLIWPLQDRPNAVVNERRNTSAMRGAVIQRSVPAAGIDHSYYQPASRGAAQLSFEASRSCFQSAGSCMSMHEEMYRMHAGVRVRQRSLLLSCDAADREPMKHGGFGPQYGGTSYQERVSRLQVTQLLPVCASSPAVAPLHAKPLIAVTVAG